MMKSFVVAALAVAGSLAMPVAELPEWTAPGPGDVRSPCPLLNSLANHNFIPHNGKGMTVSLLAKAFKQYINVGADVASAVGAPALTTPVKPNGVSFDLNDIDKHNVIEHDGSLSRGDVFYGDDHTFNPLVYGFVASHFTEETINIPTAAKARFARMTTDKLLNPGFNLTTAGFMGSFTESSFYLSVFGDPYTGIAPTKWVNVFFAEERLPYAEGWTPRKLETNLTTLGVMAMKVMAATPNFTLPLGFDMEAAISSSAH